MSDLAQAQRNAISELLRISWVISDLGFHFNATGHRLYLIGGSVRGAMLDGLGHDLDFTTSVRPEETHAILRDFTLATWDIDRGFGTIGAMKREDGKEWQIEAVTFRADAYEPDSRKPVVAFGERIEEDLVRHDFTIDTMAVDIVTGEFVNLWNGLCGLADSVLCTPAPAEVSFDGDPLRMIRATRFALRLGFRMAPEVQDAMREMAERITIVSAERVQAKLTGLLLINSPCEGLGPLVRTGVVEHFLPELPALRLERDEHMHHKDIYAHSLTVLEQAIGLEKAHDHQPDTVNRLAVPLCDIGKPTARRFESSEVTLHHHDVVGTKLMTKRLRTLKYPTATVKSMAKLVELHLRFCGYSEASWSDSAVCRYVHGAGDELERLHILTHADCTTRNRNKTTRLRRSYEELEWYIDELAAQEETKAIRPDLSGAQIVKIPNIIPGPEVGKAYKFLLNHRMDDGPPPEDETRDLLLT